MNQIDLVARVCGRSPRFAWFLGAGASRAAGHPTASDIIWDLKWRHYCREENQDIDRADLQNDAVRARVQSYFDARGFTRFLDDGRICLTNNAAERCLRGIALGREIWLFAGSDRGGERAAAMYTLIVTAKLNDVDPQAWLADVLARIAELPHTRVHELLPWNWKAARDQSLPA